MSRPTVLFQILHDIGGAAWFGGSLMGAVGLNGASHTASLPQDRIRVSTTGWARWSPIQAAAMGAHLIGGAGLLIANRDRAREQAGVRANTVIKTLLTVSAIATTAYSGVLGARIGRNGALEGAFPVAGAVQPSDETPGEVADAQGQLRLLQLATPALTGAIVGLGAQQSQQQRPELQVEGRLRRLADRAAKAHR